MKIIERVRNSVPFKSLKLGDVFFRDGVYMLKVEPYRSDMTGDVMANAVGIANGRRFFIDTDSLVVEVNAELIVERD